MNYNSPQKIALVIALTLSIVVAIIVSSVGWMDVDLKEWSLALILFCILLILSYLIIYYAIEKFIYKKIKLIYKTIYNLKITKDTDIRFDTKQDVFQQVNKEVMEWAKQHQDEIHKLKVQEDYRREFIGNVSHELKTPIFNMQGYILTLLEGGLEDKTINRKYLMKAEKNVDRLINIVQDLDIIYKLEAGQLILDIKKVDITALIKEVTESLEMKAKQNNISFKIKIESDAIWVMIDKERIRQVLVNLVVNAINYGKKNGVTEIRLYDMDENVLIEVADNGLGIEARHLPRLFERFYRVDDSRSRDKGGTGLGLAIVKHIIDAHKQTINVRSTQGIGSTFSFTLKKAKT